ncbi:MAG: lipoprotein [Hyphomicrobiaceae bacterium]
MLARLGLGIAILALAGGLAGCGVRGPLEPPPSATADDGTTGAVDQRDASAGKSNKTFVLDGLIQ